MSVDIVLILQERIHFGLSSKAYLMCIKVLFVFLALTERGYIFPVVSGVIIPLLIIMLFQVSGGQTVSTKTSPEEGCLLTVKHSNLPFHSGALSSLMQAFSSVVYI